MKALKLWIPLFLVSLGLSLSEGCRKLATPTFPAIMTATATRTATNTLAPTNTLTATPTLTQSSTATLTFTRTNTRTSTSTLTPTDTGAATSTSTETPTITNTPTVTDTPTATATGGSCQPASVQTTYTFEGSVDCWHADSGTTIVTGVNLSSVQVHGGTQSLAMAVTNSAASNQNAQFEVTFASPQNMAGAVISYWMYVEGTLNNQPAWTTAVQPFAQDPWAGNWQALVNQVPVNSWFQVAVTLGAGATTITQFGVQLTNIGVGAYGNLYIDDISINLAPAPTPTFTSTPTPKQTWDFEDNTMQNWVAAGGNVVGTTASITAPGYNASLYCFNLNAPFTAQGQGAGIAQTFGVPLNLTGGGIRCYIWMDAGTSDGYPGAQIAPSDGTTTYWGFWSNINQGAWTQYDSPASTWTGVNAANITQVIIQAAMGGTGTVFATGNVKIDNIEAY